jgi:hypothetical protein
MQDALKRTVFIGALLVATAWVAFAGGLHKAAAGSGYAFDDSAAFSWVDACATGTTLATISDADDDYEATGPFGFTFNFGGTDYTEAEATSNGVISLDAEGNDEYSNEALPTTEFAFAALFPWWDDLDTGVAGQVCADTVGTAPDRAFVVQWDDVADHDIDDAAFTISFEAVMCEGSNNVVFQYLDTEFGDTANYPEKDNAGDATVGIQESETAGLQYSSDQAVINDNMAIVFYPTGGSAANCLAAEEPPTPTATSPAPGETPVVSAGGVDVTVSDDSPAPGDTVEVTATATDADGNPIEGAECTFRVYTQPGDDASVGEGPVTTDASGQATTTLDVGSTVGTVEVLATCGAFAEVLAVDVGVSLPPTGAGGGSSDTATWLLLAVAGLGLTAVAVGVRLRGIRA